MPVACIKNINHLIGPLFGPHMRRLLVLMREEHGFTGSPYPSVLAQAVNAALPDAEIDTEQCPEMFAAHALQAFGQSVDMNEAAAESKRFQKRYEFHSAS